MASSETPLTTDSSDSSPGLVWWHVLLIVLAVCFVIIVLVGVAVIVYFKLRSRPITVIQQPIKTSASSPNQRKKNNSKKGPTKDERPVITSCRAPLQPPTQREVRATPKDKQPSTLPPSDSNVPAPSDVLIPTGPVETELSQEKVNVTAKKKTSKQSAAELSNHGAKPSQSVPKGADPLTTDKEKVTNSEAVQNDEVPYFTATKVPSQRQMSESNEI